MFLRNILCFCLLVMGFITSAQQPKLVIPIGHTAEVLSASFSPDGKKIITVSADGTAKLWEAGSGTLLNDYKSGGDASAVSVTSATFSPGGGYVIINYGDEELSIWDVSSGKKIWNWSGTPSYDMVPATAAINHFSPDGQRIAMFQPFYGDTISPVNLPTIYENSNQQPVFSLHGHKGPVTSLLYSDDGKQIITAAADSTIKTWNAGNGRLLKSFKFKTAAIQIMQLSNKTMLLTVDSLVRIFDIVTGKQTYLDRKGIKQQEEISYQLSPDGTSIIGLSGYSEVPNDQSINEYTIATVWDTRTGKLLFSKTGLADQGSSNLFSPDGKNLILIAADRTVKIIDVATGELIHKLSGFKSFVKSARYDGDGKEIITTLRDSTVTVWDTRTGKLNPALGPDTSTISANIREDGRSVYDMTTGKTVYDTRELKGLYKLRLSYSGDKIFIDFHDRSVAIWNAATGKQIASLNSVTAMINDAVISDDGKFVAIASADYTAKVWDITYNKIISECRGRTNPVKGAWLSMDNSKLLILTDKGKKILNIENGKLITDSAEINILEKTIPITRNSYDLLSPDSSMRLNWGADIVQLLDAGNRMMNFANNPLGPNNGRMDHALTNASFSPDSRKLILTLEDNTTRIFNIDRNRFTGTIILFDSTDYINQLKNGYYQSTPNAAKLLHYITNDSKIISFEQLDVKYNRPDKVLVDMDCRDSSLISSFYNAYIKRISKLGIDIMAFRDDYSVPEADFLNRDAIGPNQKNNKLVVHIKGSDNTYKLNRFNLWINEVPLFGMRGCGIRNRQGNVFDTTVSITLSDGENRIETSVTNINGIESYRKPLLVNYDPGKPDTSKVYFIGIGINHFADSSNDLKWCVQDIKDLARTMQSKYGNQLVIVDTLYNERATRTNIRDLKKKLLKAGVNDKVIISYSGHGLLSKDYDYYLSSYTVNFSNPVEGGIPYDEIENMLDSIPARKKILLLDACNSGEVDKDEIKKIQTASFGLAKNQTTVNASGRGVILTNTIDSARIGLQNSFELMQSLFVNVGKGTGAIIIAASGGVQFAQERSELGHGVFTYSVIEAMRKYPFIKVSALKKYVGDRVMELTNGLQKPTTRNETISVDWDL